MELSSIEITHDKRNISQDERLALHNLKHDKNIVIKKADKSNTVVIMNTNEYISEGMRQLNTHHYEQIDTPNVLDTHSKIQERIHAMYNRGSLDKPTFSYLTAR